MTWEEIYFCVITILGVFAWIIVCKEYLLYCTEWGKKLREKWKKRREKKREERLEERKRNYRYEVRCLQKKLFMAIEAARTGKKERGFEPYLGETLHFNEAIYVYRNADELRKLFNIKRDKARTREESPTFDFVEAYHRIGGDFFIRFIDHEKNEGDKNNGKVFDEEAYSRGLYP